MCPELYATTPPSERLRLMLSLVASGQRQGTCLMYADVSRAYVYAKAVRPVYVKLPEEDMEPGDERRCGTLMMSMYGTRDAALNWAIEYGDALRAAGYKQGRANPCLFCHAGKNVSVMVHGDDFRVVGPKQHLRHLEETLQNKCNIKTEKLGRGEDMKDDVRMLNKVVGWTEKGLELEADPSHAELVVKELGLENANPSSVPGSKAEAKKRSGEAVELDMDNIRSSTKARIDVGKEEIRSEDINLVEDARKSANGQEWKKAMRQRRYRRVWMAIKNSTPKKPDFIERWRPD